MISIIIPTYNERDNITRLIKGTEKPLGRASHEILVVDDESPDGTAEIVKKLARKNPSIRLLSHTPPRDLGRSILMGVEAVRGDVIVGMDGDGNHDPGHIPRLLDALEHADLVVGSRFVFPDCSTSEESWLHFVQPATIRGVFSFLFNAILKYCFGFPIWDNTSGFYAIRRRTLLALDPRSIFYGYGEYHLRLVYKAMQKQLTIVEVPVIYPPRLHGQSKSRIFIMLGTYLATAVRLRLGL